jgi:hypothetical protein
MIAHAEDLPWPRWLDLIPTLEDLLGDHSSPGIRTVLSLKTKADAISRRSINVRPERVSSRWTLKVNADG